MNTPPRPPWVTDRMEAAAVMARDAAVTGHLSDAVRRPDDPHLAAMFEDTLLMLGHALHELDRHAKYDRSAEAVVGSQLAAVSMAEALWRGDQPRMHELMPTTIPELTSVCATLAGIVAQLTAAQWPDDVGMAFAGMRTRIVANGGRTPDEHDGDSDD